MFHNRMDQYSTGQPEECTPDPNSDDQYTQDGYTVDPSHVWGDTQSYHQTPWMTIDTEGGTAQSLDVGRTYSSNMHSLESQAHGPVPDHNPPRPLGPGSSFLSSPAHQPTSVTTSAGDSGAPYFGHAYRLRENQVYQDDCRQDLFRHVDMTQHRTRPGSQGYPDVEQGRQARVASSSAYFDEDVRFSARNTPHPLTFTPADSETEVPYGQRAYGGNSHVARLGLNNPTLVPADQGRTRPPCVLLGLPYSHSGDTVTSDGPWSTWEVDNHVGLHTDIPQTSPLQDSGFANHGDDLDRGSYPTANSVPSYEHLVGARNALEYLEEAQGHSANATHHIERSGTNEGERLSHGPTTPMFDCIVREGTPANTADEGHRQMSGEHPRMLSPSDARTSSHTSPCSSSGSSPISDTIRCHPCNAEFTGKYRKGNFWRHIRIKHGDRVYACEEGGCDKVFKRQDARLKHYRKRHSHRNTAPPAPRKNKSPGSSGPSNPQGASDYLLRNVWNPAS